MMTTSWRKLFALLATLALVAAACGSDGDAAADGDDEASATTQSASEPEVAGTVETASAEEGTESSSDRPADWPDSIVFGAVPAEAATLRERGSPRR